MSLIPEEQRTAECQELRELAQQLRDLSTSTAAAGHEEAIASFATQAEKYADMITNAVTPELASAVALKAKEKRVRWQELLDMLQYAQLVEGPDGEEVNNALLEAGVQEAEAKLRAIASQLRAVAASGGTAVFDAIGAIATQAETGLAEFLAAATPHEKLEIYSRVEESRAQWLQQMNDLHTRVADGSESQAPTEVPDVNDVAIDLVDDPELTSCQASDHVTEIGSYFSQFRVGGGCSLSADQNDRGDSSSSACDTAPRPLTSEAFAVPSADLSPEAARDQLVAYFNDDSNGFLATLRRAVAAVSKDDRFQGAHEDSVNFLESMELAVQAVTADVLSTTSSDAAESRLEVLRRSQLGANQAKKMSFALQKYDIYKRKGKMPRLSDEHPELFECAKAGVELANFLRKTGLNAILDTVTGLVTQTGSGGVDPDAHA